MPLSDLRVRLDQANERIVSRLKDRSRLPVNEQVYLPDKMPLDGMEGKSFLEYALIGLESYQDSLGRFSSADQHRFFSTEIGTLADGKAAGGQAPKVAGLPSATEMLDYYRGFLPRI